MSPHKQPWFRFYTESMHDLKLQRLTPAERWVWVAVLCLAGESHERGTLLVGVKTDLDQTCNLLASDLELSKYADTPIKVVRSALYKLDDLGMIHREHKEAPWHVKNWKERQYESDVSTERVSKYRSKQRYNTVAKTVDVTLPDTDTDTDTDKSLATATQPRKKTVTTPKPRPKDLIFEALAECSNLDWHKLTTQERAKLNTAAKELKAIEATPDEIKERAECYRKIYPNIKFTAMGLCSNWSLCASQEEIQEYVATGAGPLFTSEAERKAFYTGEIIVLPGE